MLSVVLLSETRPVGTQIALHFSAAGPWGDIRDMLSVDLALITPTQLSTKIKQRVIQIAAEIGHTITAREIWILGLNDEQDFARKAADQVTSSASFVDVADLAFTLAANAHYKFKFFGAFTAAAAATGLHLSVSGPASPVFIRFVGQIGESVTTLRFGAGGVYDAAIAGTTSAGATPLPFVVEGSISPGADVTQPLVLRMRSETPGSDVTILRGSIGELFAA
jgi:hypothetical protein